MSPIERETKLVVSGDDYRRIREWGRVVASTDQLNIYYQDPRRIREAIGYVRVRFESGRAPVVTLKIPAGWRGEMREMVEVDQLLSDMGPDFYPRPRRWVTVGRGVPGDFRDPLHAAGILCLRRLGWMRNHRYVLEIQGVGRLELDRTVLPDRSVHHEVEIEHPFEDLHRILAEKVRAFAPSAESSRIGKFARFLSAAGLA